MRPRSATVLYNPKPRGPSITEREISTPDVLFHFITRNQSTQETRSLPIARGRRRLCRFYVETPLAPENLEVLDDLREFTHVSPPWAVGGEARAAPVCARSGHRERAAVASGGRCRAQGEAVAEHPEWARRNAQTTARPSDRCRRSNLTWCALPNTGSREEPGRSAIERGAAAELKDMAETERGSSVHARKGITTYLLSRRTTGIAALLSSTERLTSEASLTVGGQPDRTARPSIR